MSVQRLKKVRNYRHGYASRYCGICDEFVTVQITGIGGADLGKQPRCRILGQDAGKAYRINPNCICDAYDGSKGLARLKGNFFPAPASDKEWAHDRPPNETPVEVEWKGNIIIVEAFYGRDGSLPHWRDKDGNCWPVSAFRRWKLAAQAVHAATGINHTDYSMNVVVLAVSDKKIREISESENAFIVRDAGHTELEPGTETCAAFYAA